MADRMRFGPVWGERGVTFRLWAPNINNVALLLNDDRPVVMNPVKGGWYEHAAENANAGDEYRFQIDNKIIVPDPASRFQPAGITGPSELVHPLFAWTDSQWKGRSWEEAVIYELHIGTFTTFNNYQGVEDKLDYLAGLGITAIELMPVADFEGKHGWGYDGVLPYAPHAAYGRPEDLKRLVDAAHRHGLMIFLDVVYNHFGPAGNYLHSYAEGFFNEKHHTPWGAGFNFETQEVRDFFIGNALYWLQEYHFDGLRFDAVHAIADDSKKHFLFELAEVVRAAITDRFVHLILENDNNQVRYLPHNAVRKPEYYTAQWNDDFHHVLHVLLTSETRGYYEDYKHNTLEQLGRCLTEGFAYQGEPSPHREDRKRGEVSKDLPTDAFIAFLQNHDQIGNRAHGERITQLMPKEKQDLAYSILLLCPQIPMLFMGEEWSASTPFLYFCDFEGDLADAVCEGRRKEFHHFPEFADAKARAQIPDPNSELTFIASCLRSEEAAQEPFNAVLSRTKRLLEIRHNYIIPFLKSGLDKSFCTIVDTRGLHILWAFKAGMLESIYNFSNQPLSHPPLEGKHIWGDAGEVIVPWGSSWKVRPHG